MRKTLSFVLLLLGVAASGEAQSLRGSRASVDRMFRQAQDHDLSFFETASGVRRAVDRGDLVRLSGNGDYKLGAVSQPFVLPTTRTFVHRLAAQYRARCGERLVVTSGTRPKSLRLANSTDKSVHPTGMAVDLRKPTQGRCLTWLRNTLSELEAAGVLEATEEHRPPHFHVAVFPRAYGRYAGTGGTETASSKPKKLASAQADKPAAKKSKAADASENGRKYKVRRGDSIWAIARKNKVTVADIRNANNLRSSRIEAGQVLVIPQAR